MTQFGIQNQFPLPLTHRGWQKLPGFLLKHFSHRHVFSKKGGKKVVNRGRECGNQKEGKQRPFFYNNHQVSKLPVASVGK